MSHRASPIRGLYSRDQSDHYSLPSEIERLNQSLFEKNIEIRELID
jgi:hypothetical protein